MSLRDENAEVVRRAYEAFNTADMATLTELFDENASWHTPGRSSIAGDYQGRDEVFGQFGRFVEGTGGSFKAVLQNVYASQDGRVVAPDLGGQAFDIDRDVGQLGHRQRASIAGSAKRRAAAPAQGLATASLGNMISPCDSNLAAATSGPLSLPRST